MTPGNRIRRARKQKGLTLRELELRTTKQGHTISRSSLGKLEADKACRITLNQMAALAKALSMSTDWCLLGDEQPAYAIGKQAVSLPEKARKLIMNAIDQLREIVNKP